MVYKVSGAESAVPYLSLTIEHGRRDTSADTSTRLTGNERLLLLLLLLLLAN